MSANGLVPAKDETRHNTKPRSAIHKNGAAPSGQVPPRPQSAPSSAAQHARANPQQLTPSDVMQLQRTIGNRAVSHLLMRDSSPATGQTQRVAHDSHLPSTVPSTTAATPIHVQTESPPSIQRVVQSKYYPLQKGGFLTKYYSTFDTQTEFDTPDEAWEHDAQLAQASTTPFDDYQRYPTNYSYYNVDQSAVMPLTKQGPHTLSHSSISFRLRKRMQEEGGTKRMWKSQMLGVQKFGKYFKGERPAGMKKGRRKRFKTDYGLLHNRLSGLMATDDAYSEEKHELMMRLMQLHPYAAYGKGKVGKKRLKNKGERRDAPFDTAFDKLAKFNVPRRYAKFQQMRKLMYKDDDKNDDT